MLLTAALSLSLFSHLPGLPHLGHHPAKAAEAPAAQHRTRVGPWRIAIRTDRFAATRTCAISGHDVALHRDTLIFRLGHPQDARGAMFKLDAGPARPVSDVYEAVQAKGFFPQRGWIIAPEGGEVALPAATVTDAQTVTIRLASGRHPRRFKVARLAEATAAAQADGCTVIAP